MQNNDYTNKTEYNSANGIGIINLQITDNYGANLLAYATECTVKELFPDREVFTINAAAMPKELSRADRIKQKITAVLKKAVKYNIRMPYLYFKEKSYNKSIEKRQGARLKAFESFRRNYLNLTKKVFSAEEIKGLPINTLVIGSDIVWSPSRANGEGTDMFFATGFGSDYRRISYAASLGTNDQKVLTPLKDVYRENLKSVDCISVRGPEAKAFLAPLTDKNIRIDCDPVFLLSPGRWSALADSIAPKDEKYIFVYLIGRSNDGVRSAKKLAAEKGLKIYYCCNFAVDFKNAQNCYECGPVEFLSLIKNAEYVITNSFHSVIFSIVFKRQFKVYSRQGQFSKLKSILDRFNLQGRYSLNESIDAPIDFDSAAEVIRLEKQNSLNYLKNAILGRE